MKGWLGAFLFIVAASIYAIWLMQRPLSPADEINEAMMQIVTAKNVAERETALSKSLEKLSNISEDKNPIRGNGNFYLSLGDIYRQFNALPWAMWSYQQAEKLAPNHPIVEQRIAEVNKELQLKPIEQKSIFDQLLFFHLLSLPRRLQLFTLTLCLAFAFASAAIWQRHFLWKTSSIIFGAIAFIFLASSLYTRYVEPVNAVAIEGALLLSAPNENAAMVGNAPISAGATVLVMDINDEARWVRVLTDDGSIGYVPTQKLRLIY